MTDIFLTEEEMKTLPLEALVEYLEALASLQEKLEAIA
jgi:hypothetical protein